MPASCAGTPRAAGSPAIVDIVLINDDAGGGPVFELPRRGRRRGERRAGDEHRHQRGTSHSLRHFRQLPSLSSMMLAEHKFPNYVCGLMRGARPVNKCRSKSRRRDRRHSPGHNRNHNSSDHNKHRGAVRNTVSSGGAKNRAPPGEDLAMRVVLVLLIGLLFSASSALAVNNNGGGTGGGAGFDLHGRRQVLFRDGPVGSADCKGAGKNCSDGVKCPAAGRSIIAAAPIAPPRRRPTRSVRCPPGRCRSSRACGGIAGPLAALSSMILAEHNSAISCSRLNARRPAR